MGFLKWGFCDLASEGVERGVGEGLERGRGRVGEVLGRGLKRGSGRVV